MALHTVNFIIYLLTSVGMFPRKEKINGEN